MRHTLRLFTVVLGAVVGLGLARTAGASCDVPLTIGGASAVANVLILLDNSASMNQVITSTSYNANVTYAGKFKAGNTYSINTSKYYTPNMIDNKQVAITPSAYLVASDCNTAGDYTGNYLNWIYYNATAAQIAAIPVITRIQSAKACVTQIFNTVTGCNFGLEVYSTKGANTGQILCNMGSTVGHLDSTVAGLCATTCTPLAGSLDTAKSYFQTTGANACITASCQKNFLIIVTDGLPIRSAGVKRCRTEAMRSYRRQLRSDHWPLIDEVRRTGEVVRTNENETAFRELLDPTFRDRLGGIFGEFRGRRSVRPVGRHVHSQ